MDIRRREGANVFFVILIVLVVLCSSLILSTFAWLQEIYIFTDNNSHIGKIDVCLYANDTKVTGSVDDSGKWTCNTPYTISASSTTIRSLNLKMRNEGNIDALVRVTINVYYMENNNKRTALLVSSNPTTIGTISLDTSSTWVTQFPSPSVACGYMFYNNKLPSYTTQEISSTGGVTTGTNASGEVSIINSILVSDNQIDTTFYVDVTIDAVAYSGNIYKKINGKSESEITSMAGTSELPVLAYPFGSKDNLPEAWTAWM